jgi:hypothetical protein
MRGLPVAAEAAQYLEIVADQTLVLHALPDQSPDAGRRLEQAGGSHQLFEAPRRRQPGGLEQVPAEEEQPHVGAHRDAVEPASILPRGEGGGDESLPLFPREVAVERDQPTGGRELGRPGHVHVHEVERRVAGEQRGRVKVLAQIRGLGPLDEVHPNSRMVPFEAASDRFPEGAFARREHQRQRHASCRRRGRARQDEQRSRCCPRGPDAESSAHVADGEAPASITPAS